MSTEAIAERLAVQEVMLNYAAGVDDRERDRYASCFAQDLEVIGFGAENFSGRQAWVKFVWTALEKYSSTQHMLSPPLVSVDGDRASARTDVQALHYFKEGEHQRFILWATYFTDLQRIEGAWKIVRHELVTRGSEME
jgi:uncharacterized protein (TIGR02246 family)